MAGQNIYVDAGKRLTGFNAFCGLRYDEISDNGCTVSCELQPHHLNPRGVAHGGLIATLTDVAAGCMALQADRSAHSIVTQSCDIHYLRPGTGEALKAMASVIRKGSRVCVVGVNCYNTSDGSLAATAIYEIAYLDMNSITPGGKNT